MTRTRSRWFREVICLMKPEPQLFLDLRVLVENFVGVRQGIAVIIRVVAEELDVRVDVNRDSKRNEIRSQWIEYAARCVYVFVVSVVLLRCRMKHRVLPKINRNTDIAARVSN